MQTRTIYVACKQYTNDSCALQSYVYAIILAFGSFTQHQWKFLFDFNPNSSNNNIKSSQIDPIGNCISPNWIQSNLPINCNIDVFRNSIPIDLIICLGGDGTILNVSHVFQQQRIAPILAFNFGTLGFLSNFQFDNHQEVFKEWIDGKLRLLERKRVQCKTFVWDELENDYKTQQTQALNEILVGRKEGSHMVMLDVYVNDELITCVNSDGIIFASPSGSTAYSLSAGGCLVHPNVNCILFTPICPHTLSLRPVILPGDVKITVRMNQNSRTYATVHCDSRSKIELNEKDYVEITVSSFPIQCYTSDGDQDHWFVSLSKCLQWNSKGTNKFS